MQITSGIYKASWICLLLEGAPEITQNNHFLGEKYREVK